MRQMDQASEHAGMHDFLRERLRRADDCMLAGSARGAITYYESTLPGFHSTRDIAALHETYRVLLANKVLAHMSLREFAKAKEAEMFASRLPASHEAA